MVDLSSSFFCKRLKQRLAPEAAGRASGEGLRDARPWALRGEGVGFGTVGSQRSERMPRFFGRFDLLFFGIIYKHPWSNWTYFFWGWSTKIHELSRFFGIRTNFSLFFFFFSKYNLCGVLIFGHVFVWEFASNGDDNWELFFSDRTGL